MLVELVVDEWLIEYLSPEANSNQVELAHSITRSIKRKCDKLIFTQQHFARFSSKANNFVRQARDGFYHLMVLHPLTLLLYDSTKVERRSASHPSDIVGVKTDDFPVLDSAFGISTQNKLIITTDIPLKEIISKYHERYGLKCVAPENYLDSTI